MTRERALGWFGLFLIGLIGAAYQLHDWLTGAPISNDTPQQISRLAVRETDRRRS